MRLFWSMCHRGSTGRFLWYEICVDRTTMSADSACNYVCMTVCACICCGYEFVCLYSVVASGPWLFDVCISPAVMTVAAAGWVSGELIISVCHLWWGWSCDTGNNCTAGDVCVCVYTCLCEEFTWRALHITERHSCTAWHSCHCAVCVVF